MPQQECVTRERLEKYLLGDLSEADWQAIAAHVEACPLCEETVSQLDRAEDTLLTTIRNPEVRLSQPSAYLLAARRAKSLYLSPSTNVSDGSATAHCLRDYELIEPIARGGMSTVYRAMHQRLRRLVAVKVLPDRCLANPHAIARFQREMQAVGQLRHPAIVQATDGGEVGGVHFLVMELIDGMDLSSLVKCLGPLPCADACELARRTALGLAHAHEQGVIHRDVKPSNVMLTMDGEIKILDLGLARIIGEQLVCDELTTVGQLMGTVDYMAPEQFENSHHADERCDVYGLGATLFRLLAGQAPYSGSRPDSPLVKLRRIAGEPPPPLSTRRSELPVELCRVVDRMLSRRPEDRPAGMTEVATALEPWCAGHRLHDLIRHGLAKQSAARSQKEPDGSEQVARAPGVGPAIQLAVPQASGDSRGRKSGLGLFERAGAVLLLFGLLAALGIVITIQTSGGQLVIETAVPDIEVRVVRAGHPVKTMTLKQQPNSLRLSAGEYEVQFVGPTDGLQIENNKFALTRGQTVVARVVLTPLAPPPATVGVTAPSLKTQLPEPRYEGKITSEWIAILFEDRSPDRVIAAFDALRKLGIDQEQRADAIKAIFHAARFHEKLIRQSSPSGRPATTPPIRSVWFTAVETLRSFDAAAVVAHASTLLEDPEFRPKQFVLYVLRTDATRYGSLVTETLRTQLRHFAEQGPTQERDEAMNALAKLLGESDPQFLEFCRSWLSIDDFGRLQAARWLVAAKQSPTEVVTVLRPMLKSAVPELKAEIVDILGNMGSDAKPAVPELIAIVEALNQPSDSPTDSQSDAAALHAINALGAIGDLAAAPVLIREWRRRIALNEAPKNSKTRMSQRGRESFDASAIVPAIQTLTGLVHYRTSDGEYWAKDGTNLSFACSHYLVSGAGPEGIAARQKSVEQIEQILIISTDAEVEKTVVDVLRKPRSYEPDTDRVDALMGILRPKLPAQSETKAMLSALSQIRDFKVGATPEFTAGYHGVVRSIQQLLAKRAAESAEARNQIFDALAQAIESSKYTEFVLYVDTLVALGIPDVERSKRIETALEKARDPTATWKEEAVNRGLKHLRVEADNPPSVK